MDIIIVSVATVAVIGLISLSNYIQNKIDAYSVRFSCQ